MEQMSQICPVPLSLENMNTLLRSELIIIIQHPGIFMYFDTSHLPSVFSECDAFFISHRFGGHQSLSVLCAVLIRSWLYCDPMDCSPPGSSVHGILQARILEWAAISSSRGSSQLRNQNFISWVSCIAGGFFLGFFFAGEFFTAELLGKPLLSYIDRWIDFYIYLYLYIVCICICIYVCTDIHTQNIYCSIIFFHLKIIGYYSIWFHGLQICLVLIYSFTRCLLMNKTLF